MGGARVTTVVTLRKCTLGHKREIKTLKFVSASTKGFKGGLAWIKSSKKDMAVTFSYSPCGRFGGEGVAVDGSGRVPSPPLAGAWWFACSPAGVALVSSGGGGCRWRR